MSCKHKESGYHSLSEKIQEEGKHYKGTDIPSDTHLTDINLIEITEGEHTFLIPERKSQITSFACAECHSKSLDKMYSDKDIQRAHWDIQMLHANDKIMNCTTCHNGDDMDNLKGLLGDAVDFNQSYLLCAQCHTNQFESWTGGAHGKNIGGWAPPRAAMTCVNCHDPHSPQIASKWPVQFNTQIVKERE